MRIIGNQDAQPEEIRSLELLPTHPSSGALVRTQLQAVDADEDPLQYTYEWTLNGSNLGESDAEVVLEGASRGDQLQLIVRVHDGIVEVRKKATLVVSNSPPTLGEVELGRRPTIPAIPHILWGSRLRQPAR